MNRKAQEPVPPCGMHVLFEYECPHCHRPTDVNAPSQPGIIRCVWCGNRFPIIPVDPYVKDYFRLMTCDGRAAADPDYL